MIDYSLILCTNYVGKAWSVGETYDSLQWFDETPKPTQAELDALWVSTKVTVQNQQAERQRAAAYVAESDPLFFKAQRGEATMEEWQSKVSEIKTRYPKA
jgi:hypothetical protein